jgi:hypothetical protein
MCQFDLATRVMMTPPIPHLEHGSSVSRARQSHSLETSNMHTLSPLNRRCRKRKLDGNATTPAKLLCRVPVGTDHKLDMNLLRLRIDHPIELRTSEADATLNSSFDRFLERQSQAKLVDNAMQLSRLREQKKFVEASACMSIIQSLFKSQTNENEGGGSTNMEVPRNVLTAVLDAYCGKPKKGFSISETDDGTDEVRCQPHCSCCSRQFQSMPDECTANEGDLEVKKTHSCSPLKFQCTRKMKERIAPTVDRNEHIVKSLQQLKREVSYVKLLRDPRVKDILLEDRRQRNIKQAAGIASRVPAHGRKRFQLLILHGKRFQSRRWVLSDYNEIKVAKPFEDNEIHSVLDHGGRASPPRMTRTPSLETIEE